MGKARGGKGCCILDWSDVVSHADGLIAILVPDMPDGVTAKHLRELRDVFGARGYLALSLRRRPDGRTAFTVAPGPGDGATSGGGPDPRDPTFPRGRTLGAPPFGTVAEQDEIPRTRSHDFH